MGKLPISNEILNESLDNDGLPNCTAKGDEWQALVSEGHLGSSSDSAKKFMLPALKNILFFSAKKL